MLSPDLSEFLESGVSIVAATRDARMVPESVRVLGARVHPGGAVVDVFLPRATSARAVANLRDNGAIAVTFSRPTDHRTFQLKGVARAVREATEDDRITMACYRAAFAEQLHVIGMPRKRTLSVVWWPAWVVETRVDAVFAQTPGPGAGAPLAGGKA